MKNPSRKKIPVYKPVQNESLESSIDSFTGTIHNQHVGAVFGKEQKKKFQHVTKIMDIGPRKGLKSHREYGHNRKFILAKFTTKEERVCAHVHLLGDFIQDILHNIMVNVGKEFKKGTIEGPFYEQIEKEKWGWDIKKNVIEKLIKESSSTFIQTLKGKNRIGGSNCD